ncbi:hypothetical protein G9U51_02505 [Calidifontibacter sp. DB0510]|uniref:Uncharacterized protein n=1 Tax=Metallococcus carri TaxID=1656884 RepID=A0A967AY98_9MICO|nr:hypothetical protein [Metallococcus carri]NHN54652.1 hypothetical protein [Metallococcus carri]NOP36997.1 hypothetical protein [Calidifontibacter sp. DB2511S]
MSLRVIGRRIVAGAVPLALLVSGCASPSPTMSDFQTKTRTTARAVAGTAAVAQVSAQAWSRGQLTDAYADTLVTEAEDDVSSIIQTYDSRQPPTAAAVALKGRLDKPLQDISSALTDLRIALRRNDRRGVAQAVAALRQPLTTLGPLQQVGL